MTRGRLAFFALSAVVVLFVVAGSLLGAVPGARPADDSFSRYLSVFTEVLSLVRQAYVDEQPAEGLFAGAFDGLTDALDPFSVYVPAASVESFLAAETVGARHSGLRLLKERGMAYVVGVDDGGPAAAAGIEPGDLVSKIQGRSTRLLPVWQLQQELAKDPGAKVDLELIRRGQRHDVTLELEAFRPARASLAARDGALVLRIPGFDESTTADVARLVAEASGQESAGLLIDLRGVGGGDSAAAYAVADLFADGALGALRSRDTTVAAYTGTTPDAWRDRPGQLVVAMDRGSQGPAEVLATVLRQRAQARLVGERSFGYAGRRKLVELSAGDRLLVTDGFFAGPDGDGIDEGLAPDLLVDERSRRFGEQELPLRELILERGLRLLREAPAPQPAAPAAPAG